jgi:hypothetical protein
MLTWKDALGASGWGKENRSSFGSHTKKLCSLYCENTRFGENIVSQQPESHMLQWIRLIDINLESLPPNEDIF